MEFPIPPPLLSRHELSQVLQYAVKKSSRTPSPEQFPRQPVSPRLRRPQRLHGELGLAAGELQVPVDARADAREAIGPAEGGGCSEVDDFELRGAAVGVDLECAALL